MNTLIVPRNYLRQSMVCCLLLRALLVTCEAQFLDVATEGCSEQSGVLAYRIVKKNLHQICVARGSSQAVELLFTKSIPGGVTPPLCLSNAVIVVGFDGTVTKYGLDGTEVFSIRVLSGEEVSRLSGKWNNSTIYLTAMSYKGSGDERKPNYRCIWIDVHGKAPVQRGEVPIAEPPLKLFRVENYLVACGQTNVDRIAAPIQE